MTEHILIKKVKQNGKDFIEISMYGDYQVLFSMLVNAVKSNEVLSDLVTDASLEITPLVYNEINLN